MMSPREKGRAERALYCLDEARRYVDKACDRPRSDMVREVFLCNYLIECAIDRMRLGFEADGRPSLREIDVIELHLSELEGWLRPDRAENWRSDLRGARYFLDRFDALAVKMHARRAAHGVDPADAPPSNSRVQRNRLRNMSPAEQLHEVAPAVIDPRFFAALESHEKERLLRLLTELGEAVQQRGLRSTSGPQETSGTSGSCEADLPQNPGRREPTRDVEGGQ